MDSLPLPLLMAVYSLGFACQSDAALVYFNDFSSGSNALSDFVVLENGTADVLVESAQLRIDPGFGYRDTGHAAIDLTALTSLYSGRLSELPGRLSIGFNLSNTNDPGRNNSYGFGIFNQPVTGFPNNNGYGYNLSGGGAVGDYMRWNQSAAIYSPFGQVGNTIYETTDGLSPLPNIGAFRIEYDPDTGRWAFYFEQSDIVLDPLAITDLVDSSINAGFADEALPFLSFRASTDGSTYLDNISVTIVPEPSSLTLLLSGLLLWRVKRTRKT